MNTDCNIYGSLTGAFGGLLVISEILGFVKKVKANSILEFFYLFVNHLMKKPIANESTGEVFIDLEKCKTPILKQIKIKKKRKLKTKSIENFLSCQQQCVPSPPVLP
jgi:hypothetical protein